MAFSHGSVAQLAIDPAGGSSYTLDLSAYLNEASLEIETDDAETSTFGNTAKTFLPGLEEGTIEIEGLYDPTVDAGLDGIRRDIVSFRYRPAGTGSGLPQYTGSAFLTSYTVETTVDEAGTIEGEFMVTGPVVRATQ